MAPRILSAGILVLSLAGLASAQSPVSVSGSIQPIGVAIPCAPGATHELKGSQVYLRSSILDLNQVSPIVQRFLGTLVPNSCQTVDVTAVQPSPITINVCNPPHLGCTVTLDACPSPGSGTLIYFVSPGIGFTPVTQGIGTFLLDPGAFITALAVPNTAVCQSLPLNLSGPPGLIGVTAFFQVGAVPAAGTPRLSNLTGLTIGPPAVCQNFPCF